jgi:aldehyde dehydrogenase (NAD+)
MGHPGSTVMFDPGAVPLSSGSLIGGKLIGGDGADFDVLRPSDGCVARHERGASPVLVDRAVALARAAHRKGEWARATPQHRGQVFRRWADLVQAHADELVQLEALVSSRLAAEAVQRDIPQAIAILRYYGEMIDKVEGQLLASAADTFSFTRREPHGVVAAISPWNVPLILATVKIAPALAAGNAVVLKPSELTPYSIRLLAQLGIEAGLPSGQLAVLHGVGPETGHALVTHPEVDYVSFTGSTRTGAQVMADAALSGPKPVSLELGGKSPQLVLADADLERAARLIAGSVTRNAGQVCFAGTRLVAHRSVSERLTARVIELMRQVKAGPTWNRDTTLSPIISLPQRQRIASLLEQGLADGGELAAGGSVLEAGGGYFFEPTVVTGVAASNSLVREEIFGPVLVVQEFDELEEGLALADHAEYGLAAGVHTANLAAAVRCSHALQAGTVWVNHFGPTDISSPVGGYKRSGFGKDFGTEGLQKYFKTKHVWLQG